ncbi:MAG: PspA/IM30 family protein [Planctomycetota bacterium]|jgi:phage shock protein A|nr:PspA/IM30 family protein [Planctomycetota bacterium]
MYENLRGRVSRIISAGISSVIGSVEGLGPEAVMEEAIQEVNEAAGEVRAELGRTLAAKHLANKRLTEKNALHAELDDKIGVAVREKRDDLAEAGIAQQLDIEAQLPVLRETVGELSRKEQELESYVAALGAKKREMQEELSEFRKAKSATEGVAGRTDAPDAANKADLGAVDRKVSRASSAFERIMGRETGLPAAAGTSLSEKAKLVELDQLNRDNRIRERLFAIKASNPGE